MCEGLEWVAWVATKVGSGHGQLAPEALSEYDLAQSLSVRSYLRLPRAPASLGGTTPSVALTLAGHTGLASD